MSNKKLSIDGPAGRNEVTNQYRSNYDRIFGGIGSLYYRGVKVCETRPDGSIKYFPTKSKKDGGDHAE
jgi:hypothetical protein